MSESSSEAGAHFLFFSADANRSELREGKAWDKVLDPIATCVGRAGLVSVTFAYPGSLLYGEKTFLNVQPVQRKETILLKRLVSRGLAELISKRPPEQTPRIFRHIYSKLMALLIRSEIANPYRKPLVKLKPNLVFATNANPLLCETSGSLGIPVVEVLHARGNSGFYKTWRSKSASQVPDGVIAYDDASAEAFRKVLPVLQLPNYRYSEEKALSRRWELSNEGSKYLESAAAFPHVIAFTATYGPHQWGPDFIDGGIPIELLRLVDAREDTFLQVRLHPVMRFRQSYFERLAQLKQTLRCFSRVNFETASKAPLYSILGISTVHLTFESLAVYEAADDGLSSYFLRPDLGLMGWAPDLIRKGIVKPLDPTKAHLEAAIENAPPRTPPDPPTGEFDLGHVMEWARQL